MSDKHPDKTLEKVLHKKIKPVVDEAMHKFLGITIDELSQDISDKIETRHLIDFDINVNIPFKIAKKLFKKQFIQRMIETHYGNVSEVARITGLDRRSIHRAVKQLDIDIKSSREKMLKPDYYSREQVDSILRDTLNTYSRFIHPEKLIEVYKNVESLSGDIIKELPQRDLTWKEAVSEFESIYLEKALIENQNLSNTAKKIKLRYETLIRKLKKHNISY